jgi:hypothetical protein
LITGCKRETGRETDPEPIAAVGGFVVLDPGTGDNRNIGDWIFWERLGRNNSERFWAAQIHAP